MTTGAAGTGAAPAATGAQGTGAAPTGAAQATGSIDPRLKELQVPEKYSKEPWAKEVKSVEDMWDKMNGLNKIAGKDKITLPGDNATADELNEFHTRMGRPENAEGYEFKNIEGLSELERNVDLDHGLKNILFKRGTSKEVGEGLVSDYENLVYEMQKPMIESAAQRDVEFQKLADETLGEDKASAIESFKGVMRESLGDKAHLAAKIEGMDNDQLLTLMVFAKNINDKYTGESRVGVRPGSQPGLSGDLKTDFQTLSGQKLAIKTDKNMPEHIKKMKLANINTQMMKIGSQAKDKDINLFA